MIHKMVVGVDGTDGARRALEWTTEQARDLGAEVVAVFALRPAEEFVMSIPPMSWASVRSLRASFDRTWCQPLRDAGVPFHSVVVEGDPARELILVADREHAQLLVVGAHDAGGFTDRLLGSVSYDVTHHAHCPVVVVPAPA